jgi:hypothetical protein
MAWRSIRKARAGNGKAASNFRVYISTGLAASMNGDASDTMYLILHILAVLWNIK